MFSQFTTRSGRTLIIRAIDIRSFEDSASDTSTIIWEPTPGQLMDRAILGTAQENLNRLKQEETEALIASEKIRQRQTQGYPAEPIGRGKQSMQLLRKSMERT